MTTLSLHTARRLRLRPGQEWCPTCGHPADSVVVDSRGHLLRHVGRAWPCRVPTWWIPLDTPPGIDILPFGAQNSTDVLATLQRAADVAWRAP